MNQLILRRIQYVIRINLPLLKAKKYTNEINLKIKNKIICTELSQIALKEFEDILNYLEEQDFAKLTHPRRIRQVLFNFRRRFRFDLEVNIEDGEYLEIHNDLTDTETEA